MTKYVKKARKVAVKSRMGRLGAAGKVLLRDVHDRDFRANGFDVILQAGVAKEVSAELAKALLKQFPYLEVVK